MIHDGRCRKGVHILQLRRGQQRSNKQKTRTEHHCFDLFVPAMQLRITFQTFQAFSVRDSSMHVLQIKEELRESVRKRNERRTVDLR